MGDFNADKCGKTKDVKLVLVSDCDIRAQFFHFSLNSFLFLKPLDVFYV